MKRYPNNIICQGINYEAKRVQSPKARRVYRTQGVFPLFKTLFHPNFSRSVPISKKNCRGLSVEEKFHSETKENIIVENAEQIFHEMCIFSQQIGVKKA